jgi:nucleoside 2-deoxyribosyltransferase
MTKKMLQPRDVYLAAPFFTDEQRFELETVESMLRNAELSFFSPRLECLYEKHSPDAAKQADRAFFLNERHLGSCRLVLAGLTWKDDGTAWELGYAHSLHLPRLGFSSNDRIQGNLMIHKTVTAMVKFENLSDVLGAISLDIHTRSRSAYKAVEAVNDPSLETLPEE